MNMETFNRANELVKLIEKRKEALSLFKDASFKSLSFYGDTALNDFTLRELDIPFGIQTEIVEMVRSWYEKNIKELEEELEKL